MSKKIDTLLYNLITEKNLADKKVIDEIIEKNPMANGAMWIHEMSKKDLVDEKAVLEALAEKLGITFMSVRGEEAKPDLYKKVPVKIASYYQFIPLKIEDNVLTICSYYPIDIKTQDEIRFHLGFEIRQVLSTRNETLELLRKNYGLGAQTLQNLFVKEGTQAKKNREAREEVQDIEKRGEDATISNLVDQIIFDAYKKRATDIHIEPYRGEVRFRYRIDGVLYDAHVSPDVKHYISPILSRIKIMSNLDIVEHRLPQDGQAVVKTSEQRLDLRVSCIPTPFGESIVIRILPTIALYDINKLGLTKDDRSTLDELLKKPNGIIFVTGPTGSGKTTTLYACLNKLNTHDRKIITIEDPIEYEMSGITQIQINQQIGLGFAAGLKSMLRHDPDIMMVGEVRDIETAEIAIRVALTGHLVFSTLHTNSAAASIHRLLDIGIEPYLVYSSCDAFIAQRLVRVLCPRCKTVIKEIDPNVEKLIKHTLKLKNQEMPKLYKSVGCNYCNKTGYYDRTAIYEILLVSDPVKNLIQKRSSASEIEHAAVSMGMKTLLYNGLEKVVEGVTSMEEIMNILAIDSMDLSSKRFPETEADGALGISGIVDKNNYSGYDQRVYARLSKSIPVLFTIYKGISADIKANLETAGLSEADYWNEHNAFSDNISAGGLVFKYNLPLVKGTVLNLKISAPASGDAESKIINCLARVVRVEKADMSGFYNIAVCFLDMSGGDRTLLNNFVESVLKGETI